MNRPLLALAAAAALYAALVTAAIFAGLYGSQDGSPLAAGSGFGEIATNWVRGDGYRLSAGGISFTAARMPAIVFYVIGSDAIHGSILLALLVKNLAAAALLFAAGRWVWTRCANVPRIWLTAAAVYVLSFPKLMQHGAVLDIEEGFLIAPVGAIACWVLLRAIAAGRGDPWGTGTLTVTLLGIATALLFLTKSSMLGLSIALCAAVFWLAPARRALIFSAIVVAGFVAWGLHVQSSYGSFGLGNSWNWVNAHKGNHPETLTLYPTSTLDHLDAQGKIDHPATIVDEWQFGAFHRQRALANLSGDPLGSLERVAVKAWVFFVDPRSLPYSPAGASRTQRLLGWLNLPHMLLFRIALACALAWSLRSVYRTCRTCRTYGSGRWREPEARLAAAFLLIVGAYSAPYVVGFGYTRHAVGLVVPTVAMLACIIDIERAE